MSSSLSALDVVEQTKVIVVVVVVLIVVVLIVVVLIVVVFSGFVSIYSTLNNK